MSLTEKEIIDFIYATQREAQALYEREGLKNAYKSNTRTRRLLDDLGQIDLHQRNILVTGSKGKGSVSRLLAAVLESQGYKVGLYTSPHLMHFRERIRMNGKAIPEEDFIRFGKIMMEKALPHQQDLMPYEYMGYGGMTLAIALLYYDHEKTDFNIFECGKGAQNDDVNVIHSVGSIINRIFAEHIPELGYNIIDVAYNKARIMHDDHRFCISSAQENYVDEILEKDAKLNGIPLLKYGRDVTSDNMHVTREGSVFDVKTRDHLYEGVSLSLRGPYQVYNTALALLSAEQLIDEIDLYKLNQKLSTLVWHGRLELISEDPMILIDGTINTSALPAVDEVIEQLQPKQIHYIIGIPDDKDYLGVIQAIHAKAASLILTKVEGFNIHFDRNQLEDVRRILPDTHAIQTESLDEALKLGMAELKAGDLLCILGTQSLMKEAKQLFNQDTLEV